MKRLILALALTTALSSPSWAQTVGGQVRTYMGPSLGEQWVLPSANTAGFGTGVAAWLATPTSLNLKTAVTNETGSGALVFADTPTLVTPVLGTPTSGTLTNTTGFPTANLAGAGTGVLTFLATPSSANLISALTDESGTGAALFGTNPTMTTPHMTTPLTAQGAPTAVSTSAVLTTAALLSGIITVNQAGGAASAQQLPLGTDLSAALPTAVAGDSFDFSVINISVVDAEDASITTNTDWTLVGNMDIPAYSAVGSLNSSARFRARKTGAATWVLYRLS